MQSSSKNKVILATPMYGGMATSGYIMSIMQLQDMMRYYGINFNFVFLTSESLITRGRNILCKRFLEMPDATHLLFIDADIEFQYMDVIRMLAADKDIIGCPYACKTIMWNKIAECAQSGERDPEVLKRAGTQLVYNNMADPSENENKIKEVLEIGTGLMLIKRCVLEHMISADPDNFLLTDYPADMSKSDEERKYHCFFDTLKEDHRYLSEDYMFCKKWRSMGGKIYMLTDAQTKHWGMYAYE